MPTAAKWSPDHRAIWTETVPGDGRAITVRHPTYPYEVDVADVGDLPRAAAGYLEKIRGPLLKLPPLFADVETGRFAAPLAWLPITDAEPAPPRASSRARRYGGVDASGPLVDETIVLLAVQSATPDEAAHALGSRLGIRIIAHVGPEETAKGRPVRIAGATVSRELPEALAAPAYPAPTARFFRDVFAHGTVGKELDVAIRTRAAGHPDGQIRTNGYRVLRASDEDAVIEAYLTISPRNPDRPAYAVTVELRLNARGAMQGVAVTETCPLIAHAVEADVFPRDPASQGPRRAIVEARPNREPAKLQRYRKRLPLPGLTPDGAGNTPLEDDPAQAKVTRSTLVDTPATGDEVKVVELVDVDGDSVRTNDFAAVSAYQNARALFDTMRSYGLRPEAYFRLAALPLRVRHRATITPGPGKDGKTVNAQVNYSPPDCDVAVRQWPPDALRPLQVRFGLADVKRSASRREPLGLAADPRWSWHEYGHVLLGAATGALELHFAHSVGDALAAILCDPDSELVERPGMEDAIRGATFPWVYLNRRHDRSVFHGWGWCGRYHRPARFPRVGSNCTRKGYDSEQILSASLFRLYRALGGDARRHGGLDRAARRAAADYTAYLIMRAIEILGPAVWTVATTPDQLVSALIAADIGTLPVARGPLRDRVGGWAHKVVRWAFEAQGLYATDDDRVVVDGPGQPPPVDVFVDDGRPDAEGRYTRGGYVPVSLDWHSAPRPRWHATRDAIAITDSNEVTVQVHNRGRNDAEDVVVQVWWREWPANKPQPDPWGPAWKSLGIIGPKSVPAWTAASAMATPFGPFTGITAPAGRRVVILAAATCPLDLANTDPATGLPCATEATPIVDLVAGDNNLGLRVHRIR